MPQSQAAEQGKALGIVLCSQLHPLSWHPATLEKKAAQFKWTGYKIWTYQKPMNPSGKVQPGDCHDPRTDLWKSKRKLSCKVVVKWF